MSKHARRILQSTAAKPALEADCSEALPDLDRDVNALEAVSHAAASLEAIAQMITESSEQGLSVQSAQMMGFALEAISQEGQLSITDIPAFQCYKVDPSAASQLSLEGVKEMLVEAFRRIKEFLIKLFKRIGEFLVRTFNETGRMKLRLAHLHNRAEDAHGLQPKVDTIQVGRYVRSLGTERAKPTDGLTVVTSLKELHKQLHGVRTVYLPVVLKIGDSLRRTMHLLSTPERVASMHGSAVFDALKKEMHAYDVTRFMQICSSHVQMHDSRYPSLSAHCGTPLPGCRSLAFVDGQRDEEDGSSIQMASTQASRVELIRLNQNDTKEERQASMNVLPLGTVEDILDIVKKIIEEIDAGRDTDLTNEMEDTKKQFEKALHSVEGLDVHAQYEIRMFLRYCEVYGVWLQRPYLQLLAHAASVCKAAMYYSGAHIDAYGSIDE